MKDALNDADIEVESARDGARDLWTRIAVTLAALTAVGSLRWVPLPCVDLFQIEELGLSRSFAVGGLGMAP